jgi:tetratricopeptide (TPR) repeat protein
MQQPAESLKPASDPAGEAPPRSQSSAVVWLVVLAAAAIAIGPLLGSGLHRERARWRIATGLEHWLDGDLPAALAELDAAAEIAPDLTQVFELRSQFRIYAADYAGALADAESLLSVNPLNSRGIQLKGDALVYLGRGKEAAELWADFAAVRPSQYDLVSPALLNGVAYYRALGNYELATAWAEINAALQQIGQLGERAKATQQWRSSQVAFLDTRGYIRYLRGDREGALEDLNLAVFGAERQREEQRLEGSNATRLGMVDPRTIAWQVRDVDRTLAVIRFHRALALEALGRTEEAEKDLRRVRELGFEPDEKLF